MLSSREEQGLIVLVSVITSCLQTLHSCDSKLAALELILHLAPRLSVDILLDRITPYLLHFCNDPVPRVCAQAVRTLTKVLALVKEVPRNDVNIYPEYILPGVAHLAQDDATIVRLAYAGRWITQTSFMSGNELNLLSQDKNRGDAPSLKSASVPGPD